VACPSAAVKVAVVVEVHKAAAAAVVVAADRAAAAAAAAAGRVADKVVDKAVVAIDTLYWSQPMMASLAFLHLMGL
jgi:hypothetical protein